MGVVTRIYRTALLALLSMTGVVHSAYDPGLLGKGGKLGVGAASAVDHPRTTKRTTTYMGGLLLNYPQNRLLTIQGELALVGKGYVIPDITRFDEDGQPVGKVEGKAILTYLEMPILAKVMIPAGDKYMPYLSGGFFGAFLLSKRLRLSDIAASLEFTLTSAQKFDAGVLAGAGIDLKAGEGKVFFEIRYEAGMLKVIRNENTKTRLLSFQAGYWF